MTESNFRKMSQDHKKIWKCRLCKAAKKIGKLGKSSPSPDQQDDVHDSGKLGQMTAFTIPTVSHPPSTSLSSSSFNPPVLPPPLSSDFERIVAYMDKKLDELKVDLRAKFAADLNTQINQQIATELKTIRCELSAIEHLQQAFDNLSAKHDTLFESLHQSSVLVHALQEENTALKTEIAAINTKLSNIDQINRSSNIEIQSVPESRMENTVDIFAKLCSTISYPCDMNSIKHCHRVAKMNNQSNRPRNIIVTLSSPLQRDQLISAVKQFNKKQQRDKLNSKHLDISGDARPIYVCEHLTPANKALHAATRKAAIAKNFKYVWVRNGKIYMRKGDTSKHIIIRSQDCLSNLS